MKWNRRRKRRWREGSVKWNATWRREKEMSELCARSGLRKRGDGTSGGTG